tara:strand:- start:125 stop:556 length:432 start_codon:yes stop_codon:yes gene_type:complete
MKETAIIMLSVILISCHPFDENRVLDYKDDLVELVTKIEHYDNGSYGRDETDEFVIGDIRKLNIDLIVKNTGKVNPIFSGFVEESDSLIIFINRSNNILDVERRIIYDFNKNPRNFGNDSIIGASYKIVQLDERWYYSEIGLD